MWDRDLKMEIENMIRERERDIQKQMVDKRGYNERYKEII